jgi:CRISPR system Cascade subunit CasE
VTPETHMVQITLDTRKLARWMADRRLGDTDIGYACHALMCDAYGDMRLKPFHVEEKQGRFRLLGYGKAPANELTRIRQEACEPETSACVMSEASKLMPAAWEAGRRYSFRLRVAPTRQGHKADGRWREADALMFEEGGADRETTYRKWLSERIGDAVALEVCSMVGFQLLSATRRAVVGSKGKRPARSVTLPDVVFEGVLTVKDAGAFASLVRDGVGRHKAFGFGALMLRPPRAD